MSQLRPLLNYIAGSDPFFARNICMQYGHTVPPVKNEVELGGLLQELVQLHGEPAFIKILDHHPDKELILVNYGTDEKALPVTSNSIGADGAASKSDDCGCKGCKGCQESKKANFANADAAGTVAAVTANQQNNANNHQITSTQTGLIILSCAIIISLAIMAKK